MSAKADSVTKAQNIAIASGPNMVGTYAERAAFLLRDFRTEAERHGPDSQQAHYAYLAFLNYTTGVADALGANAVEIKANARTALNALDQKARKEATR